MSRFPLKKNWESYVACGLRQLGTALSLPLFINWLVHMVYANWWLFPSDYNLAVCLEQRIVIPDQNVQGLLLRRPIPCRADLSISIIVTFKVWYDTVHVEKARLTTGFYRLQKITMNKNHTLVRNT